MGEGYSLQWPILGGSTQKGHLFRPQVYERVSGIPLVVVYEGIQNLSFLSIKGLEMHFMAVKKSRNRSGFVTVLLQQSKGIKCC